MLKNKDLYCFQTLRAHIYHAKNIKMPIVDILSFMSMINFMLCQVEHENVFITLGPYHYRPASKIPSEWCFAGRLKMARFKRLTGFLIHKKQRTGHSYTLV